MTGKAQALLALTADVVAAHVRGNTVSVADVGGLIERVHGALANLGEAAPDTELEQRPAVSVRASVKPDHLVCLEDGKKMKMLKRHLRSDHGLTPDDYRAKWGLAADYPMAAPNYSNLRRELAIKSGLGRKPGV